MFIPNEIITEILNIADCQTWKDKIKKINRHYHSYYEYNDDDGSRYCGGYGSLYCKIHGRFVANWRNNGCYRTVEKYIYPICVNFNFEYHAPKNQIISKIKLPHNY